MKESAILPLFFFSYVVFSLCMGLTIPVWLRDRESTLKYANKAYLEAVEADADTPFD